MHSYRASDRAKTGPCILYLGVFGYREYVVFSTLLESLYKISSMLCSQEHSLLVTWIEYHAVAEFLVENNAKVMLFCDIMANDVNKATLQRCYCEIHNLDVFPTPFTPNPPPPAAPQPNQELPMQLRGGGEENDGHNSAEYDGIELSEEEEFCTAATFQIDGSPITDSQQVGAEVLPFIQRAADSPEKQSSQREQLNNTDAAAAAG